MKKPRPIAPIWEPRYFVGDIFKTKMGTQTVQHYKVTKISFNARNSDGGNWRYVYSPLDKDNNIIKDHESWVYHWHCFRNVTAWLDYQLVSFGEDRIWKKYPVPKNQEMLEKI